MAVQTVLQETITNFTCVGSTLIYQNEAGLISEFDLLDKIPDIRTVLNFNPTTKLLSYLDEANSTNSIDLSVLCSTFAYNSNNHSVLHNGVPHQLNCGTFGFDTATCTLSYTDEKSVTTSYIIPQDQFFVTADGCGLVIIPAKGGAPITVPLGVPASDVGLVLNGKNLEFTYKDKKCVIPMPNSVIGCQYDPGTNTLRMLFCDGSTDEKALAKASLVRNVLDDGTQILVFQDGCGGQTMFNVPNIVIPVDTDQPPTVVGSVLTFVYGGDGNDAVVSIDICQILADNCNATITSQDPITGGFTFIDNAGKTFTVPGHVPPEVVGTGDITVTPSVGPNGQVIYTVNYDHVPSGPAPVVAASGDLTLTPSIGPNGEIVYTVGYTHVPSGPAPEVSGGGDVTVTPSVGPNGQIIYTVSYEGSAPAPVVTGGGDITVTPSTGPNGETVYTVSYTHTPSSPAPVVVAGDNVTVTPSAGADGGIIYTVVGQPACCQYHTESTVPFDPINPSTAPSNPPAVKNVGDTAVTKYPNGLGFFTCVAAGWVLNYFCATADEYLPPSLTKETFKAGDTLPTAAYPVAVCVVDPTTALRSIETIAAGPLPANMLGCVQVDETDGTSAYIPPKSLQILVLDKDGNLVEPSFDPLTGRAIVCDPKLFELGFLDNGTEEAPNEPTPQDETNCLVEFKDKNGAVEFSMVNRNECQTEEVAVQTYYAAYFDADIATWVGQGTVVLGTDTLTITNPSCCREMQVNFTARFGNPATILYPDTYIEGSHDAESQCGLTFPKYHFDGRGSTRALFDSKASGYDSRCDRLAPKESVECTIFTQVILRNYASGAFQYYLPNTTKLHAIGNLC